MSYDAPESAQYAISVLLYMDILSVWAWVMACDTEWSAVKGNFAEDVVSEYVRFIFVSCVRRCVLHFFFSTLRGVLIVVLLKGTTDYVLMGFKF